MMIKTKAVVLRSIKFGDSKLIVDTFTEQQGRVSFVCRIPKTSHGKIKKQMFQPLSLLEVTFDHRPTVQLQHLKDVRILSPYTSLPFDSFKLGISLFLAEFLYYATKGEQYNNPLYQYIETGLLWLDGCKRDFSNFHLVFMMKLSLFLGFYPNLDDYHPGDYFDLRQACFTSSLPLHDNFLQAHEAEKISLLMRMNFETMRLFEFSRTERNRCVDLMLSYYRLHIPGFPELRSLPVLKTLFV